MLATGGAACGAAAGNKWWVRWARPCEGPQPLRRCLFGGETLQLWRRSLDACVFSTRNLSISLSDAAAAAAALVRARAEACESAVRAASAQAARKVWGIGVRLVCIIASFNYSAVSSPRFCPSSGAWGCGGRPRRSIRWLTPLGRRSVGLLRQASAKNPLANTPWAERGSEAAGRGGASAG